MAKIFLSYRREDSAGVAGRIYDRLRVPFGPDSVFFDVDSVPFGVDFQEHIESVLSHCDVFLAVIGPDWAGQINTGRRIDDARDWVRIEVEAALKRGLPVIPVLIDHTRMPSEADLPPSLARLARRNALSVDQGRDFHVHVDRLIRGIELLSASDLVQGPKAKPQGADSSKSKAAPMPADVIAAEHVPRRVPAAPRQQEPTVWSLLRGALPKRRWFYLAALLLLALLGIILALKPIGNREATSLQEPQPPQPKGVPIASTTTWDGPKSFTPPRQRDLTNSIGMRLVRIEHGSFLMGSPDDYMGANNAEKPQHQVRITRPFFLGIHEVTQGQYQAVMGENPSLFKGSDDLPVEQVSWLDAVLFCNKLSEQEKKTPFYRINGREVTIAGGNGYRLPTEAEWEYACRAGSTTLYPFGDDMSKLGDHAWYESNSGLKTHPVGQKRPNAWGLYDMLGNVWEWCQDWYEDGYYRASPPADPPGPSEASARVIRGGSWYYSAWYCRPAYRNRYVPEYRNYDLGFRVAAVQE